MKRVTKYAIDYKSDGLSHLAVRSRHLLLITENARISVDQYGSVASPLQAVSDQQQATHLIDVHRTLRYHFPPLSRHEVQELINQKGRGQSSDAASRYSDQLAADRAPEGPVVPRLGGGDPCQAVKADRVGAGQELGSVLAAVVHTCATFEIRIKQWDA